MRQAPTSRTQKRKNIIKTSTQLGGSRPKSTKLSQQIRGKLSFQQ